MSIPEDLLKKYGFEVPKPPSPPVMPPAQSQPITNPDPEHHGVGEQMLSQKVTYVSQEEYDRIMGERKAREEGIAADQAETAAFRQEQERQESILSKYGYTLYPVRPTQRPAVPPAAAIVGAGPVPISSAEPQARAPQGPLVGPPQPASMRAQTPQEIQFQESWMGPAFDKFQQSLVKRRLEDYEWMGISQDPKVNYYAQFVLPRLPTYLISPFYGGIYEVLQQAKNITLTLAKGTAYNPLLYNQLMPELLPEGTPSWIRTAAEIGETAVDMVAAGIITGKLSQKLFAKNMETFFQKAEKMGYPRDLTNAMMRKLRDSRKAYTVVEEGVTKVVVPERRTPERELITAIKLRTQKLPEPPFGEMRTIVEPAGMIPPSVGVPRQAPAPGPAAGPAAPPAAGPAPKPKIVTPPPPPPSAAAERVIGPLNVQVGDVVYHPKSGKPLQVLDTSDPSMLLVQTQEGGQMQIGRGGVAYGNTPPTGPVPPVTPPQPNEPPAAPAAEPGQGEVIPKSRYTSIQEAVDDFWDSRSSGNEAYESAVEQIAKEMFDLHPSAEFPSAPQEVVDFFVNEVEKRVQRIVDLENSGMDFVDAVEAAGKEGAAKQGKAPAGPSPSAQARIDEDKAIADDADWFVSKGEFWNLREFRTADYRVVDQARHRMTAEQKVKWHQQMIEELKKWRVKDPTAKGAEMGLEAAIKRRRGNIDALIGKPIDETALYWAQIISNEHEKPKVWRIGGPMPEEPPAPVPGEDMKESAIAGVEDMKRFLLAKLVGVPQDKIDYWLSQNKGQEDLLQYAKIAYGNRNMIDYAVGKIKEQIRLFGNAEDAAEDPVEGGDGPLPDWLKNNIDILAEPLEKSGVADKIEELSAQRLTAKQVAERLGVTTDEVRAVRVNRGIPSQTLGGPMGAQTNNPEFEVWLKSRGGAAAAPGGEPTQDMINAGLRRSLHSFEGAEGRWQKAMETGLSDDQLKEMIAYEFGEYGGSSLPDPYFGLGIGWHKGGKNPEAWITIEGGKKVGVLKGKALLKAVRELAGIPLPGQGKPPSPPEATPAAAGGALAEGPRIIKKDGKFHVIDDNGEVLISGPTRKSVENFAAGLKSERARIAAEKGAKATAPYELTLEEFLADPRAATWMREEDIYRNADPDKDNLTEFYLDSLKGAVVEQIGIPRAVVESNAEFLKGVLEDETYWVDIDKRNAEGEEKAPSIRVIQKAGERPKSYDSVEEALSDGPAKAKAEVEPDIEYVPAEGAMEHAGSDVSVEAMRRPFDFFLYDPGRRKIIPLDKVSGVDVQPGPTQFKFQRNRITGKIEQVDKGEKANFGGDPNAPIRIIQDMFAAETEGAVVTTKKPAAAAKTKAPAPEPEVSGDINIGNPQAVADNTMLLASAKIGSAVQFQGATWVKNKKGWSLSGSGKEGMPSQMLASRIAQLDRDAGGTPTPEKIQELIDSHNKLERPPKTDTAYFFQKRDWENILTTYERFIQADPRAQALKLTPEELRTVAMDVANMHLSSGKPSADAALTAQLQMRIPAARGTEVKEPTATVAAEVPAPAAKEGEVKVIKDESLNLTKPKEQKEWLVEKVDQAIKEAPDPTAETPDPNAPTFIEFDVPGDGEFKIINTETALRNFKKLAAGLKTTPPGPSGKYGLGIPPKASMSVMPASKLLELLQEDISAADFAAREKAMKAGGKPEEPITETGNVLPPEAADKAGSPKAGFVWEYLEKNPMAISSIKDGYLTDGHMAILDPEVSNRLYQKWREGYLKKAARDYDRDRRNNLGGTPPGEVERLLDESIAEGKMGDSVRKVIPKKIPKSVGEIQGVVGSGRTAAVILTDGKIQVPIQADKFALLRKEFPNAEYRISGIDEAVIVLEGKDIKAIVMPMKTDIPFGPKEVIGGPRTAKPTEAVAAEEEEAPEQESMPNIKKGEGANAGHELDKELDRLKAVQEEESKGKGPKIGLTVQQVGTGPTAQTPPPPPKDSFVDPDIGARFSASAKPQVEGLPERVMEKLRQVRNILTRTYEHLPPGERFILARHLLKKLEKQQGVALDKAVRTIYYGITKGLKGENWKLFVHKVIFDDLAFDFQKGLPLPYGLNKDNFPGEKAHIDALVAGNPFVARLVAERHRIWGPLRDDYIYWHNAIGHDISKNLENPNYYHHIILQYEDGRMMATTGRRLRTPTYSSIQRKREGAEAEIPEKLQKEYDDLIQKIATLDGAAKKRAQAKLQKLEGKIEGYRMHDVSTDYISAEVEAMSQMIYEIEVAKTLVDIRNEYDILNSLKVQAMAMNNENIMPFFQAMADAHNASLAASGKAGKAKTAEDMYRQVLNWKQAVGIEDLGRLAAMGELPAPPNGEFDELLDEMGDNYLENLETKKQMGEEYTSEYAAQLSPELMKDFFRYISWVIKEHGKSEAGGAAAMIFKGIRQKKEFIKKELGKEYLEWSDIIPEKYVPWRPREGNMFFFADTLPERLSKEILDKGIATVTDKDVRKMLVMGGKRPAWVIPEELAQTLDNLHPPNPHWLDKALIKTLNAWKKYILTAPQRLGKYNLRNLSGDADGVIGGYPSAIAESLGSLRDLIDVFIYKKPMPKDMIPWFEQGGMESTLQVQELKDVRRLTHFKDLYEESMTVPGKVGDVIHKYWRTARLSTDFRESILRLAVYYRALKDMRADQAAGGPGKPKSWGASIPEEIMALPTIEMRAFRISNELLGAYDELSVFGQFFRTHAYPFWSWREINLKRYPRFLKNAIHDEGGSLAAGAARVTRNKFKSLGMRSPLIAWRIGKLLLKMSAIWAMVAAWNELKYPEIEDDLPPDIKNMPHLNLGYDKEGNPMVFTRLGALGDFLSMFGLDEGPAVISDLLNNKRTLADVGDKMWRAPINELVQGASPIPKALFEALMRREFYPDVFNPRMIRDRGSFFARQLDMEQEYNMLMGKPHRPYKRRLETLLAYKIDKNQSAYYRIQDLKDEFLKKSGKAAEGFWLTPRGNALYNAKLALRYGDTDLARKYTQAYLKYYALEAGQTGEDPEKAVARGLKSMIESYAKMFPLAGMNQGEVAAFKRSLSPEDRKVLLRAVEFYNETILGIHQGVEGKDIKWKK